MPEARPRVVILFPDDWAPYSPTLTRLVAQLQPRAALEVWAIDTARHPVSTLPSPPYRPVDLRRAHRFKLARTLAAPALAWQARAALQGADVVVAVDGRGALAATLAGRRFHFLSLELTGLAWLRPLLQARADSILVQSRERLAYLCPAGGPPVHLVQNAPDLATLPPLPDWRAADGRMRLVYLGNLIPLHGLVPMLDLLRALPEADLVLHGPASEATRAMIHERAGDLLAAGRLRLDASFIEEQDLPVYLRRYDIGLCFYDLPPAMAADPNYLTSPSGKMFNYFSAGLPVLASHHAGLAPVSLHKAGLQAASLEAATLAQACRDIFRDLEAYRAASAAAARFYDFGTAILPFVNEITDGAR